MELIAFKLLEVTKEVYGRTKVWLKTEWVDVLSKMICLYSIFDIEIVPEVYQIT